ncbi:hypothetical protein [Rhodovibrio sodomensis]|nr:hypothetical protein [Rhodovibrio sodomensis]
MHLIEALVISALVFIEHNTEYDSGRLLENPPCVVFVKPGEVAETTES